MVTETNRDINKLSDNFKLKVLDFYFEVQDMIFITEGFRTQERQDYLYAKGRTTDGPQVTWVKHSNHQDGNAIDIAFRGSNLYPEDLSKWEEIAFIAKKHGIDWGYDLWGKDKVHFQDNGKVYITEKEVMEIKQFGKDIIRNGFTLPKSVYGVPVRFVKGTFMGKAKVKGYLPGCTKDEILITENTFKHGYDYLCKVLMHEISHFIYHRYLDNGEETKMFFDDGKSYWENISKFIPSYITNYASTQSAEDFAELIGYSYYISNKIDLPNKCNFEKKVQFKYEVAIKLYSSGLKKHIASLS